MRSAVHGIIFTGVVFHEHLHEICTHVVAQYFPRILKVECSRTSISFHWIRHPVRYSEFFTWDWNVHKYAYLSEQPNRHGYPGFYLKHCLRHRIAKAYGPNAKVLEDIPLPVRDTDNLSFYAYLREDIYPRLKPDEFDTFIGKLWVPPEIPEDFLFPPGD